MYINSTHRHSVVQEYINILLMWSFPVKYFYDGCANFFSSRSKPLITPLSPTLSIKSHGFKVSFLNVWHEAKQALRTETKTKKVSEWAKTLFALFKGCTCQCLVICGQKQGSIDS